MIEFDFEMPEIAKGTVMPNVVVEKELKESKETALMKKQYRHDWIIAIFSTLGGAIAGLITSLIFWLLTK